MESLWLFISALAVVYLIPGADMVLILQSAALGGRAYALAAAVGLGIARAGHVTVAGLGLATLLHTAPALFEVVRWGGAAYLVWLGLKIIRTRSLLHDEQAALTCRTDRRPPLWRAVQQGLFTNLLNPKALLFCSVFLPQFIHPNEAQGVAGQFILLGAVLVTMGALFDLLYAQIGAALARSLKNSATAQRVQRWLFGGLLIGFGVRLALAA